MDAQSIIGTCPFCGAEISGAAVLVEYEVDIEMRCYAECTECEIPVRPLK